MAISIGLSSATYLDIRYPTSVYRRAKAAYSLILAAIGAAGLSRLRVKVIEPLVLTQTSALCWRPGALQGKWASRWSLLSG